MRDWRHVYGSPCVLVHRKSAATVSGPSVARGAAWCSSRRPGGAVPFTRSLANCVSRHCLQSSRVAGGVTLMGLECALLVAVDRVERVALCVIGAMCVRFTLCTRSSQICSHCFQALCHERCSLVFIPASGCSGSLHVFACRCVPRYCLQSSRVAGEV